MNMFARFGEIPAMTLQDIKRQNVTDGRTHGGQRENSIPATNTVFGVHNKYPHHQNKKKHHTVF